MIKDGLLVVQVRGVPAVVDVDPSLELSVAGSARVDDPAGAWELDSVDGPRGLRDCILILNGRELAWCALSGSDGFFAPVGLESPEFFVASVGWTVGSVEWGARRYRYGDVVYTWDSLLVESGAADEEFWSRSSAPLMELAADLLAATIIADLEDIERLEVESPNLSADQVLDALGATAAHLAADHTVTINGQLQTVR